MNDLGYRMNEQGYELWDEESSNVVMDETSMIEAAIGIQQYVTMNGDTDLALRLPAGKILRGKVVSTWANAVISLAEQGRL
jgi:hypothetical protein